MEETKFATFKPIINSWDDQRSEIRDYYAQNGLNPDTGYLNKYLENDTNPIQYTNGNAQPLDIKDILSKYIPQPISSVQSSIIPETKIKSKKDFLNRYGKIAEEESKSSGISKDLLLSQVALETGWGSHMAGNNVGGIKAGGSWKGQSQSLKTKEEGSNGLYSTNQNFRAYGTPEEGFKDYVSLLKSKYKNVVGVNDPYKAAEMISKSGYATDPKYKEKLQAIIKQVQS